MESNFELIVSVLFFVFAVLGVATYARRVRKSSFAEPIYQFLFFYTLFVLPLPIRACITRQAEGDVTEHLPQLLPYMPWAVALCAIGLPFFVWGYYGRSAGFISHRLPKPRIGKWPRVAFVVLAVLSLLLLARLASSAGSLLDFVLLGYGGTSEMSGKGYLAIGFTWLLVAPFFLLYRYSIRRNKWDLLFALIGTAINLLMNFIMGRRGMIIYGGLAFVLFWHHAVKAVSFRRLALLGLAAFMSMNLVGAIRGSRFENIADFWSRTSDSLGQASDNLALYSYTLTTGEFTVPFETLPQMIQSVGSSVNPQFGATYLRAPLFYIPSSLYPGRPMALSNWYIKQFYESGVNLNEGRQFFFLAEGYLNFGALGVLATMFVWGIFLGVCRNYLRANWRNPGAVLLYAFTVAYIMQAIAGDFVTLFVGLPAQILSAVILGLWISRAKLRAVSVKQPGLSSV